GPGVRRMTSVAVMGAGSWGTAFGLVLGDAGADVALWAKDPDVADDVNRRHENAAYHPGVTLPARLRATSDAAEALGDADVVVLAVPAQVLRGLLGEWSPLLPEGAPVVSLIKGIELGTMKRMSEVVREVTALSETQVAVVSGPNLAGEIVQRQPAATVVACTDDAVAQVLQRAC